MGEGRRVGVYVRDSKVVSGLDALRVKLAESFPGRRITREGLARELLQRSIADPTTPRRFGVK